MATPMTNTLSDPNGSTAHGSCAAHALDGEQRQRLALRVLTRSKPVTELAERHQVSRKFL
jgi:ABC-type thiamine transport system ATPase subunit